MFAVALLGGNFGTGGEQFATTDGTTTGSTNIGTGTLSGDIPPIMAKLFEEAGTHKEVIVPPALIAAIHVRECDVKLFNYTKENPEIVQQWIDVRNKDMGNLCGISPVGAAGPMQFMPPTFRELSTRISRLTGNSPASRTNLKDAVYGAGLLLRRNSEINERVAKGGCRVKDKNPKTSLNDWTENDVCWAAYHYQGNCSGNGTNHGYCAEVIANWKKFTGSGTTDSGVASSSSSSGGSAPPASVDSSKTLGSTILASSFRSTPTKLGGFNQPREPWSPESKRLPNRRCHRGVDFGATTITVPFAARIIVVGKESDIERAAGQYDQIQTLVPARFRGYSPGGGIVRFYVPELDMTFIFRHQRTSHITKIEYAAGELKLIAGQGIAEEGYSSSVPHHHVEVIPGNPSGPSTVWQMSLSEKSSGNIQQINPYVLLNKTVEQARNEKGNQSLQRRGRSGEDLVGRAYPSCQPVAL
jgi:hypothetical protein